MALVSLIVVAIFWASSSASEEDIQCSLAALVPPQQKFLADRLCKLEDSTIAMEHVLQELMNRADITMGSTAENTATDEDQAIAKRKNEFIRFGKRKNEFIRFGKRKNEFIRFGKRKNEFIRFGRSGYQHDDNIVEKRKNEFIRFG